MNHFDGNGGSMFRSRPFKTYTTRTMDRIAHLDAMTKDARFALRVAAEVFPFRVNDYVLDHLIDWSNAPDDPMFRLLFPHRDMLEPADFDQVAAALTCGDKAGLSRLVSNIRLRLNPHPAGQMDLNVPIMDGRPVPGVQHKYDETVLFFPGRGQTCHAYCSFCYRWAQFVGDAELRFSATDSAPLCRYLATQPQVTDLLVTGGDPMVMKAEHLSAYLDPLTAPEFDHVQTIRLGTKALSYWPYRFVSDGDADRMLRLFERLTKAGRQVAIMAHFNHWRETEPSVVREAVRRIRDAGAVIRSQAPVLAGINDDARVWRRMWRDQMRMGIVPYYMFVERDTGARHHFEVPLARVHDIYRQAISRVSGLARTARGPSMSAGPGKIEIQGVAEVAGEKVFVLRFIQGRNADWVQRPFFARYDEGATWFDDLGPAFGEREFFFEPEYRAMVETSPLAAAE